MIPSIAASKRKCTDLDIPSSKKTPKQNKKKTAQVIKVLITLHIFMDTIKNKTAIKKIADCGVKKPEGPNFLLKYLMDTVTSRLLSSTNFWSM